MNRKERRAAGSAGANMHGSDLVGSLFNEAVAHHQANNIGPAFQLYCQILQIEPEHADTIHLLGMMSIQIGKPADAVEFVTKAIAIRDNVSAYYNTLGNAFFALEKYEPAAKSYERAVRLQKDLFQAYNNLGNTYRKLGRLKDAEAHYRKLIDLQPAYDDPYHNLGALQREEGKLDDAEKNIKKALELTPAFPEALNTFGLILRDRQQFPEAEEKFQQAISCNPGYVEAHNNLGLIFLDQGRKEEAVARFEASLKLNPALVEIYNNLGTALLGLNRIEEAHEAFGRGVDVDQNYAIGRINIGSRYFALQRYADALAWYDKALELEPDNVIAASHRALTLRSLKLTDEALAAYDRAFALDPDSEYLAGLRMLEKMNVCDWSEYNKADAQIIQKLRRGILTAMPFSLVGLPATAEDIKISAEASIKLKHPQTLIPLYSGRKYDHKKIRVAYLSADFHTHATAHLMAGMFEKHDKSKFETTALSFSPNDNSHMRGRLIKAFDEFIDVNGMSDLQIAQLMLDREIDIAVDLKGLTQGYRIGIFAKRAAPVQVAHIGFPGTCGAPYIDYIIADRTVIPENMHHAYTEKVVTMPDSYQVNDDRRPVSSRMPARAECGLPEQGFVFAAFNTSFKITPDVFDIWMRLLKSVEGSVLWLLENNKQMMANLRREAEARGVDPNRLVFAPRVLHEDHLARHRHADIFLDNLPCNAHTTASDALWTGVPVITCLGQTFAGRVAGSLLNAVGMPELITQSLGDYEQLALKLARDPAALSGVKAKLAANIKTQPLFNTERFTRHIEQAYITMHKRHQRGEAPAPFAVDPL